MIIAGTGHRPDKLGGYGLQAKLKLIDIATEWLLANRPKKVISGMALGWDYALAVAAVQNDIPVLAAVPFKGQENAWPQQSQKDYRDLLRDCDEVVYVSDGGYAAYKMQLRNEYMVREADVLLALWNGTSGGTANCVRYAEAKGKPIINLWDRFSEE